MHEPFVDWHEQSSPSLSHIERAYQTIIGVLHLIPSNLDVSLVVTSVFAL